MGNTIFHKIIRKEIPANIVHEDDKCVAFRDVNPVAPTHILIVPRKDIAGVGEAKAADEQLLGHLMVVAKEIAEKEGLQDGYRLVVNNGPAAGQTVAQLHVHLLGGREMKWPPG